MCRRELWARRNRFKYCTWPADGHFVSKIHFVTHNKLLWYQLERVGWHSRSNPSLVLPGTSSVVFHRQGSRKVLCRVIFHILVVLLKQTQLCLLSLTLCTALLWCRPSPGKSCSLVSTRLCPTECYVQQENSIAREAALTTMHCVGNLLYLWLRNVCCSPPLRHPEIVKLRIDAYIRNLS